MKQQRDIFDKNITENYTFEPAVLPEFEDIGIGIFPYRYKDEEIIDGHRVVHLGEGIYMFEKPIADSPNLYRYSDLIFFVGIGQEKAQDCILFAISNKYRIHGENLRRIYPKRNAAGQLSVPVSTLGLWEKYGMVDEKNNIYIECTRSFHYECEKDDITQMDSGLLRYEFDISCIEEYHGYKKYIMVDGFVGRMVEDGIYYFDGIPKDSIGHYFSDEDSLPEDCEEFAGMTIGCLEELYAGAGSISTVRHAIRYFAVEEKAADRLCKLGNILKRYKFKKEQVVQKNYSSINMSDFFLELEDFYLKAEEKKREFYVEEDAIELVKGYGISDLYIIFRLAFKEKSFQCHCDYAYKLGENIILVDIGSDDIKKHVIPTAVLSELTVRVQGTLFGTITEEIYVPVIQNKSVEESFMPCELYEKYRKICENNSKSFY